MLSGVWKYYVALCCALIYFSQTATAEENQDDTPDAWETFNSNNGDLLTVHYDSEREQLYVGGVNRIYKLDARNVSNVIGQIEWNPRPNQLRMCTNFKGDAALCQNAVRVLVAVNSTHLYACGTMAYTPQCCYILKEIFVIIPGSIESGEWKSPHNPHVSAVATMANKMLFTATKSSRRENDGIISKALNGINVRTRGGDKYWLNDPDFVDIYHARQVDSSQDKVLLFLREKAEEFRPFDYGMSRDVNDRNVVSRVASICVNDHGGTSWVLNRQFSTYNKMTITCTSASQDGRAPFRYEFVESTYSVFDQADPNNPTIYVLFSMPSDAAAGTAICSYKTRDIISAMRTKEHWSRPDANNIKMIYDDSFGPTPDNCVDDTQSLSQDRLMFSKMYPIKFGSIYPSTGGIFHQETGMRYRHLLVHRVPSALSGLDDDVTVLFMTNDNGLLKRVVISPENDQTSWTLPDLQLFNVDSGLQVQKLILGERTIFVRTSSTVTRVPLAACSRYTGCEQCVNAQDPYCVWTDAGSCTSVFDISEDEREVLFRRRHASSNVTCKNAPESIIADPDKQLIAELQANLTAANAYEAARDQEIAILTEKQNEVNIAFQSCRGMTEEFDRTVGSLTMTLNAKKRSEQIAWTKVNAMEEQLSECKQQEKWAMAKAAEAWERLRNAGSVNNKTQKTVRRLELENHDMQLELFRCTSTLKNHTRVTTRLIQQTRQNSVKMSMLEKVCAKEKELASRALRDEVSALQNTTDQMRNRLLEIRSNSNCKTTNASAKVAKCYRKVNAAVQDIALLMDVNKNVSSELEKLEKQHQRNLRYIRQLTWLHRQNGLRGQQKCDYNGWFMSNSTGMLFQLSRERYNFAQSRTYCRQQGGTLAVFKDPAELRYINNVLRAFSERVTYWIGLVKYKNGTLRWQDGTLLKPEDIERFPRSQESRLTRSNIYCVETTPTGRWNLIPCQRRRRPICQKRPGSSSFAGSRDDRFFQVLVKSQ